MQPQGRMRLSREKNKDGERWKLKKHHLGGQSVRNKEKGTGRTHVHNTSGLHSRAQTNLLAF